LQWLQFSDTYAVANLHCYFSDTSNDLPELSTEPKYDEYSDDYYIVSVEQLAADFSCKDDGLQTRLCHGFGDAIPDDLEGCSDTLFEDDPKQYKLEHAVVFDESCYLKPQDHAFFHDPFVGLLESFYGGLYYTMDVLLLDSRVKLNIYVQQHFRWELSVSCFSLLKESVSRFQLSR
jgi:hypothetical protein